LGHDYPSVVPSYPSKLERRERTPDDIHVLAVPQPNTPLMSRKFYVAVVLKSLFGRYVTTIEH
jgi:hypothetical protein